MFSPYTQHRLRARPLGQLARSLEPQRTRRIAEPFALVRPPTEDDLVPDPLAPAGQKTFTVIGVDLGQTVDPAAACKVRIRKYPPEFVGPRWPFWDVIPARVWPLGYKYPDLLDDVLAMGPDALCIDYGGVGACWVDFLYQLVENRGIHNLHILPVNLVSSNARQRIHVDAHGRQSRLVPKVDIVTGLNLVQQQGMTALADTPLSDRLEAEMKDFTKIYSQAAQGRVTFEHRGRGRIKHHGDLVIACGLAIYYLTRIGTRELTFY